MLERYQFGALLHRDYPIRWFISDWLIRLGVGLLLMYCTHFLWLSSGGGLLILSHPGSETPQHSVDSQLPLSPLSTYF